MTEITGIAAAFAPFETLASSLLHHIETDDGSHDVAHLARVWSNVRAIQKAEGGDPEILAAATLLHDCVAVEKSSPLRASASRLAAEHAVTLLAPFGWTNDRLDCVAHAIAAHSFSAKITPETIEAQILQTTSRALYEEVKFDNKNVTSVDWLTYPILDITETPERVDVVALDHPDLPPTGAGEATMRPLAAAIANAVFDATGVRIRRAPLTPERVRAAMS